MTLVPPTTEDVNRFRDAIARRLGHSPEDARLGSLVELLRRRVEANGRDYGHYLARLQSDEPLQDEQRALARELTVPETYFFRNAEQFRAFSEVALPDRIAARAAVRSLRILSAGCATGEEPYSLAIALRERGVDPTWSVSIRAVDVNASVLERAARGRYSTWALRETSLELQRRWLRPDGKDFVLDESIRGAVSFEERNLAAHDDDLWPPEHYDVVFCRNVLMYFTPDAARALVGRITRSLAAGGYLFLGHAETLRGISNDYHLRHTHDTFYYERKGVLETSGHRRAAASASATAMPAPVLDDASWVEAIQRATERIQRLTEGPPHSGDLARRERPAVEVATDLLRDERYAEALELLHGLPAHDARDPDVLLLRAVLLTHAARLEPAAAVCHELIELDEMNAGAHYLLALCREGAGDRAGALEHDRVAIYLDPSFAMARLHHGLMLRRAGELDAARAELGHALALLPREDSSRVLFFGGGFSRDALVALCRAELVACGGRP